MGVMVTPAGKGTHIIFMTTSGRIAITAVIITTTTSARRNRRTKLLLIVVTRHSSHALRTDQRATSKECYKNPKNQNKHQAHNKKHQEEVHHNDVCYTSDDDELHTSVDTPVPSEDPASVSFAENVRCRHVETEGQNNRHVFVGPTCCQHVGQHVGNMTQKKVGRGTANVGPTCHLLTCQQHVGNMLAACNQVEHSKVVAMDCNSVLSKNGLQQSNSKWTRGERHWQWHTSIK
jgi:hypothetical protein